MRQDNIIAAFVFIAFIVYITMKGELPTYMGFFVPGKSAGAIPGVPGVSLNPTAGLPSSWSQFFTNGLPTLQGFFSKGLGSLFTATPAQ